MKMLKLVISAILIVFILPFQVLSDQETRGVIRDTSDLSHQSGKLGTYRALVIGIQNYDDPKIPDLKTPINDAKTVARVLKNKYGFETTLILDKKATRKAIYNALREITNTAKPKDSILIYYAGHGEIDTTFDDGWWIPVDAKSGDPVTYLENTLVQKVMKNIKSKHILLISDSCYSGTLFGRVTRAMPKVIDDKYYFNRYNEKSRWGITSGNKTPVADSGSEGHSVFAYQLIKKLKTNTKPYMSTQEIYADIAPVITNNSEQAPMCRPVKDTGDMGGEFIFVARGTPATGNNTGKLSIMTNPPGAMIFIGNQHNGISPLVLENMNSGTYSVMARLKGYKAIEKSVNVTPNRKAVLSFRLEQAYSNSKLYVTTQPTGCTIKIVATHLNYSEGMELDPGQYKIQVSKTGYTTRIQTVRLSSGEARNLQVELEKEAVTLANPNPGDIWTDSVTGMEFVFVPGGCYQMGSNFDNFMMSLKEGLSSMFGPTNSENSDLIDKLIADAIAETKPEDRLKSSEKPIHKVCVDGFWIGKYEVTQGQWVDIMGKNPSTYPSGDEFPVETVSWYNAEKFILNLNRQSGRVFKLPTEAQWEYAARSGGKNELYAGGSSIASLAWYDENSDESHHRVGTKSANGLGIFDMTGNIGEWCQDWHGEEYYKSSPVDNPTGPPSGSFRVFRGGVFSESADKCRAAIRYPFDPVDRISLIGLRLIFVSDQKFVEKKARTKLYIKTTLRDCIIRLMDQDTNQSYSEGMEFDSGQYTIQVSKKGYHPKTETFNIAEEKRMDLNIELEKAMELPAAPKPGDTWKDPVTGMEFVYVPEGCYQMGEDGATTSDPVLFGAGSPVHEVCVDGFWIGKYEVTNKQYRLFNKGHNSKNYEGVDLNKDDQPVVMVSWWNATAFAKWMGKAAGQTFDLPTEAQWEYAARAGKDFRERPNYWYNYSPKACIHANVHDITSKNKFDSRKEVAFNCNDGYAGTAPVGSFVKNDFGLHDMLGNVWEWCKDVYDENAYSKHEPRNPVITSDGSSRVIRGCGFDSQIDLVRIAVRFGLPADEPREIIGFRLLLTPVQP